MAIAHHTPTSHAPFASLLRTRSWQRCAAWWLGTGLLSVVLLTAGSPVRANTATLSVIVPKPYISGITPSTVRPYGTAVITVYGSGFTSAVYTIQHVLLNGSPAASFTVESADALTLVTPLLAPGTYSVVLTTSTGLASQPAQPGENVLTVVSASASPTPSPTLTPVPALQGSPSPPPSPSASPNASPTPVPHASHHHPGSSHGSRHVIKPSGGLSAVATVVTRFIQHHIIISISSLVIVILVLLIALLLSKRRKRKADLESRLRL